MEKLKLNEFVNTNQKAYEAGTGNHSNFKIGNLLCHNREIPYGKKRVGPDRLVCCLDVALDYM